MPKLRRKAKLKKIDGSYPERSGVLSKSIKKIVQDEDSLQGRIPTEFLISSNEKIDNTKIVKYYNDWSPSADYFYASQSLPVFKEDLNTKYNIKFDDSKIINFNQQRINCVLGVSSSYIDKINIFSPGNHFLSSSAFEITSRVQKNNVEYLKLNQNLYKEDYRSFDESLKSQSQKNEIVLDLPFDDDLILDNLFGQSLSHSFSTGDTFYGLDTSIAKNMCYYNFNSKGWDYKVNGDIDFDQNCVVSFTPPTAPHFINSSSSIGLPVQNTGFPFAGHHRGGDQNLITLNDYITDNFILDKIEVEFKLTSRIEKTTLDPDWIGSSNVDLANCLTFYILKETSNSVNFNRLDTEKDIRHDKVETDFNNNDSIERTTLNDTPSTYFTNPEIEFVKANPNIHNISEPLTASDYNSIGYTDQFAVFKKIINSDTIPFESGGAFEPDPINIKYINKFNDSTQDLVTYANFLVYSNNAGSNSNIDWNYATSDIDLVKEFFPGVPASIHFTSSSFKIESNCRSTLSYNNGGAIIKRNSNVINPYDHTIFLSNKFGGRTGLGTLSGREEIGIYPQAKIIDTQNITTGLNYKSIISGSIDSPYVLKPSDRLIFGIHCFSNISEFPAVFKLHDKIRLKLIGRYANQENNNIILSNKQGMTSNSIRSTIIGNTTIVDQYDTEPIHFMSGSYLDNKFSGNISSSEGRVITGSLSSGLEGSFTRTVTLKDTKNTIYDSIMPSIVDILKLKNKSPTTFSFVYPEYNFIWLTNHTANVNSNPDFIENYNASDWKYEFPFDTNYVNIKRSLFENISEKTKDLLIDIPDSLTSILEPLDNNRELALFVSPKPEPTGSLERLYAVTDRDLLNKIFFGSILSSDREISQYTKKYGYSELTGGPVANLSATPPISSFKYGVYNANPVTLTRHYNWRSYGQFSDRYNGTTNTAFFNQDQAVIYPIRKTFVDSNLNDIEASSAAYTYNTDDHARSGRPFFD